MFGRVILALIWAAALGATAVAGFAIYHSRRDVVVRPASPPLDRWPPVQRHQPLMRWTVTEQLSAHHVLIAQVETEHLHESLGIARELTAPLQDKYLEVLIYFHRPGRPDTLPPRRVQWSRAAGFIETVYH